MTILSTLIRFLAVVAGGFVLGGAAYAGIPGHRAPGMQQYGILTQGYQERRHHSGLDAEQRQQMRQQMRQHWQQVPPDPRGGYRQPEYRPDGRRPSYHDRQRQDWRQPYGDERRGGGRSRY